MCLYSDSRRSTSGISKDFINDLSYDQGITHCDLGTEVNDKLIGWVDSDFGSDPDTRK